MLGVLVAYCMWSLGSAPEASWSILDRTVEMIAYFVIDGKFYTILATLFGLGFSIQLGRAESDSKGVALYCRRLTALAGIGLLHALLLRNGDILLPYALTGFLMVPLRRRSDRTILLVAGCALLAPLAAHIVWQSSGFRMPERPHLQNASYLVENIEWVRYWYRTAILTWPVNLTLFLFGLLIGRHQLLTRLADRPRALAFVALVGLGAGVMFFLAKQALAEAGWASAGSVESLLVHFHCWGISTAYAAILLLALRTATGQGILNPLAAIGRLALTNYLMQAGIIVPLCLMFGWFDRFTPTTALSLALAIFLLVQVPFSLAWTRRFQFGPAEWVWRTMAYGHLPPLKSAEEDRGRSRGAEPI